MPEAPVVKHSAACTVALTTCGDTPKTDSKDEALTP